MERTLQNAMHESILMIQVMAVTIRASRFAGCVPWCLLVRLGWGKILRGAGD